MTRCISSACVIIGGCCRSECSVIVVAVAVAGTVVATSRDSLYVAVATGLMACEELIGGHHMLMVMLLMLLLLVKVVVVVMMMVLLLVMM